MKVYRALGVAVAMTVAAMACTETPSTPTSASSAGTASPFDVKYTIMGSAGANGTISPAGPVSISASGTQGFKITPDENYHVADVRVDGTSIGPVPSYTFTDVRANHTIIATFAINDTVDGLYTGSLELASVRGGECVGADLSELIGDADLNTVSISTRREFEVSATVRSFTTGLYCSYRGDTRSALFAVNDVSCNREVLYQCSNGNTRIVVPIASTMTAFVSGNTATGTVATSFNVYSEESGRRVPVAGLVTQERFDATRR